MINTPKLLLERYLWEGVVVALVSYTLKTAVNNLGYASLLFQTNVFILMALPMMNSIGTMFYCATRLLRAISRELKFGRTIYYTQIG